MYMSTNASPEAGDKKETSVETSPALIVSQPKKLEGLLETLMLLDKVSETIGEDHSGDMGSGVKGSGNGDDDSKKKISLREQAIANLPAMPVMQKRLKAHIETEVRRLRREIKHATRKASKPGAACKFNTLYARIRRLNSLLADLFEASQEVLKRLYVKIFVDKQRVI